MKPKGLSDINASRLKAFKKAQRESTVMVKPLVVQDKKKRASKRACRNFKF
jgi:hypothetical protein